MWHLYECVRVLVIVSSLCSQQMTLLSRRATFKCTNADLANKYDFILIIISI